MTNKNFVASNGIEVCVDGGDVWLRAKEGYYFPDDVEFRHGSPSDEALAEYFQHKKDEELGRWRDTEKPEFVCYPYEDPQWVTVIDEKFGSHYAYNRSEIRKSAESAPRMVAARYFAAHPPVNPWEEAKEGEVWVITHEGVEGPAIVSDDEHFESPDYVSGIYNKAITAGYRIWPTKED